MSSRFDRSATDRRLQRTVVWLLLAVLIPTWPAEVPAAEREAVRVLEDNAGGIKRVAIMVAAGEADRLTPLLYGLLTQLGPAAEGDLLCTSRAERNLLRERLQRWPIARQRRFRVLHCPTVETIWARDRFLATRGRRGVCLLLPPDTLTAAEGDFGVPDFLAWRDRRFSVARSMLELEGGDIVAGRRFVLVGGTTVRRIRDFFGDMPEVEMRTLLDPDLGKRVIFVPATKDTEAIHGRVDYHLDMFLTVLSDDSVLLGDVDWGERLARQTALLARPLPTHVDADAEDEFEMASLADTRRRLKLAEAALRSAGLRVHRVPLHVVPGRPYAVTFNNVLQEETSTGRVVYLPWYGGTLLDDAAGAVYRRLGYTVRRVDVRRVYQLQGALRCVVNVVDRTPSTVIVGKRGDLHRRPVLPGTHRGRPKNRDLPAPMRRGA